jgi:hypothetical protein
MVHLPVRRITHELEENEEKEFVGVITRRVAGRDVPPSLTSPSHHKGSRFTNLVGITGVCEAREREDENGLQEEDWDRKSLA